MKNIFQKLFFFCFFFFFFLSSSFAAINYTVTPIKYELELAPGESVTLPASIRNNGDTTVTLPTATSDFRASGYTGQPQFIRKSELVFSDQELSTWITIDDASLTVAPGEEQTTNFTINVPANATPGGRYGAIFFKNDNSESSTSGNALGINVDYGILILLKVKWDINIDIDIQEPIIKNTSKGGGGRKVIDSCAFWDLTPSVYDGKCIGNPFEQAPETTDVDAWAPTNTEEDEDDFNISFDFPIENKGNIHVEPTGKITLINENGEVITQVGKESQVNDYGAVVGEKIVDYIPLNDEGGNVLPNSKRIFESDWKGFPYQSYDENGNIVIKYWSPSEYYSRQNQKDNSYIMPWERLSEIQETKEITAQIEVDYLDENGNPIQFNSAKKFSVDYTIRSVTLNPYIIVLLGIIALIFLILWSAKRRWWLLASRMKRCWNCDEKLEKDWETCPYCQAIQNKKLHKKFMRERNKSKK